MSSNVFFWGLTWKDFENSLWNGLNQAVPFFTGLAAAGVATAIVQNLLNNNSAHHRPRDSKPVVSGLAGIVTGIAASVYAANRVAHVTFEAEKALKFLVISLVGAPIGIIPLITNGGALGYFGRTSLYCWGTIGALTGGVFTAIVTSR